MERTGDKIKRLRIERGLTQKELGNLCGILEPNIRKYETHKQNPKKETLNKIAVALNVNIIDLLSDSELELMEFDKKMNAWFSAVDEYMQKEQNLIYNFRKLNKSGQEEATKRVEELTEIPRYTNPDEPPQE